jgi:hypothetical protein
MKKDIFEAKKTRNDQLNAQNKQKTPSREKWLPKNYKM